MTQKEIIKKYLEGRGWVKEGLIRGINTDYGFLGFRGDRTVRDMIKSGELEAKMDGKFRIVRLAFPFLKTYADSVFRPDFFERKKLEAQKLKG